MTFHHRPEDDLHLPDTYGPITSRYIALNLGMQIPVLHMDRHPHIDDTLTTGDPEL
jgi:hypothetical protein